MNIIAHIPAREGSKRLKKKNLKLINKKPLIYYSIANLQKSKIKNFFVNTDSKEIAAICKKYKSKIYIREKVLANDYSTSDEFNYDFIKRNPSDICVMINPICPLITYVDINNALDKFLKSDYDTLISVEEVTMQTFYGKNPINIKIDQKLQPSQNNRKLYVCNWAIAIWDSKKFIKRYEKNGYAVWGKNRDFFILPKYKSVKISTLDDFKLVQKIITRR